MADGRRGDTVGARFASAAVRAPAPAASGRSLTWEELVLGTHLLAGLPALLRRPVTPAVAGRILGERLRRREADFLALCGRAIFGNPRSPYRRLLDLAGCTLGDLETLLRREGLDGALRVLARHGVYLTVDEFKGRVATVRGGTVVPVDPVQLRNPAVAGHLPGQTSGSRGPRTAVPVDLGFVREMAVDACLDYEARGGREWIHGRWTVPGGDALIFLLVFVAFGRPPVRWFSQVEPAARDLHPRYRWSARLVGTVSRLAGGSFPRPLYAPVDAPELVLDWLREVLGAGRTPHLVTYVSSAVQLCRVAADRGLDLDGVRLSLMGEPITAARLATIHRVGAKAAPYYGTVEAGLIGTGCLRPLAPDDVHVQQDLVTLIQPGTTGPPTLPADALLLSSLRATAPLILLNVSLGDRGTMGARRCDCPLEAIGWTTHLTDIRSFEKLTAGGMTFPDADVIRVLEADLPARFGGGPADYQLVEEEALDGRPHLTLVVHPRLGLPEPEAVLDEFLTALARGSDAARVMERQLRRAATWRVERRPPRHARSGKILHLHHARDAAGDVR